MLIAIDHGNYAIKTPHTAFLSGLAEHKVKPPLAEEVVEYGGSYWTLSGKRLPYMRDKTRDSRFFVLTLFAIGREWPGSHRQTGSTAFPKPFGRFIAGGST